MSKKHFIFTHSFSDSAIIIISLFILAVGFVWFFSSQFQNSGQAIDVGISDLSIYEVEELDNGSRYLVSIKNNGDSDIYNFNYGYKDGNYFRQVSDYPIIKSGEILTFIILNPSAAKIQQFKVDISRWDSGDGSLIDELDESNNIFLYCIDKDGDGFFKHGNLCSPVDCDDSDFVVRAC